jgi:hypothetical protein
MDDAVVVNGDDCVGRGFRDDARKLIEAAE